MARGRRACVQAVRFSPYFSFFWQNDFFLLFFCLSTSLFRFSSLRPIVASCWAFYLLHVWLNWRLLIWNQACFLSEEKCELVEGYVVFPVIKAHLLHHDFRKGNLSTTREARWLLSVADFVVDIELFSLEWGRERDSCAEGFRWSTHSILCWLVVFHESWLLDVMIVLLKGTMVHTAHRLMNNIAFHWQNLSS